LAVLLLSRIGCNLFYLGQASKRYQRRLNVSSFDTSQTVQLYMHSSGRLHYITLHILALSQRYAILASILLNDIDPYYLDIVYAVEEASRFPDLDYEDVRGARISLVKQFLAQRSEAALRSKLKDIELDRLISIFKRHRMIQAVASQYLTEILSVNPVTKVAIQTYMLPSRNEIYRLYRALYQFEIYCLLFVSKRLSEDGRYYEEKVGLGGSEYGLSQRYIPNLKPCEAEELACMREYFFNYYTVTLYSCAEELRRLEDFEKHALYLQKGKLARLNFYSF
jgi:hypothetical protein